VERALKPAEGVRRAWHGRRRLIARVAKSMQRWDLSDGDHRDLLIGPGLLKGRANTSTQPVRSGPEGTGVMAQPRRR